jgi:hypothetical protein
LLAFLDFITNLERVTIATCINYPGVALQNNNDATSLSGDLCGSHG